MTLSPLPLPRCIRFCSGWLISHLIALPIIVLVCVAKAAEALTRGIASLVDDRSWTRRIFGAADRIEEWAKRP